MADEVAQTQCVALSTEEHADDDAVTIHQLVVGIFESRALGDAFDLAEYCLAVFALAV